MKFIQIYDNEGYEIESKEIIRFMCCDCGLVHDVVFVAGRKGTPIGVAMRRNKRATTNRRKQLGIKIKK
jgi:hypothetical protein